MIKILHIADIHLGMKNYGTVDRQTGLNSRFLDFLHSFDYAVDYTLKNKVDFFFFAGDAFKTREPSPTQQREFAKRIKKIAAAGIPVVSIIGNHDLPNATGEADTLEIYKTLAVDNVYISQKPELLTFSQSAAGRWTLGKNKKSQNIFQIATLPWISKNALATKKEYQRKTIAEVDKLVVKKVSNLVKDLARRINTSQPAVLIAHATVAGAVFGAERKVYVGNDAVLPLSLFIQPWDYVALGHLHKHQILNQNPPVVYAGSIERVDFGEAKEEKGFVAVKINGKRKAKQANFEFISTPARKFIPITVEIKERDKNPTAKVCSAVKKHNLKEAVVKLNIVLPETSADLLEEDKVRRALEPAYYIAGIKKEIIKIQRPKSDVTSAESITPLEALNQYFSLRKKKSQAVKEATKLAQGIIEEVNQEH
ncbi:exonuclease SbcCD subunit D [Patescibacteria group bacterium]|nr:exonuclease SbcCD subunit D [Patescibacteria group bacterium]